MADEDPRRRRTPMGRPHIALELARRRRLVTVVTDAERARLTAIAQREGKSLSAVCHALLLRALEDYPDD
jgi:hypothetical protein